MNGAGLDRVFDVGTPDHTPTNAPDLARIEDVSITGGDAGLDNGGAIATSRDLRVERLFLFGNDARRGSAISSVHSGTFSPTEPYTVEVVESTVNIQLRRAATLPGGCTRHGKRHRRQHRNDLDQRRGRGVRQSSSWRTEQGEPERLASTGAYFAQRAIIESSTIYDNSSDFAPGALFLLDLSVLHNSIIAGNVAGGSLDQCSFNPGAVTSFGYNVTDTAAGDCNLTAGTDQVLADPMLEVLAYNGGSTLTHLPATGSPAIDAGDPVDCPTLDQRGVSRPRDGDMNGSAICDAGAVEVPEPGFVAGLLAGSLALAGLGRRRVRREATSRS